MFNLGGLGVPMIVAFFSIPYLISVLGAEKFGLLALIWAVVSYVGIFDLGLGRALTLQVSRHRPGSDVEKVGSIIGTGYSLLLFLGFFFAIVMLFLSPVIVGYIKGVSNFSETENAFKIMVFSVPFIIMASGFKGVLEARHEFAKVNYVRLPVGIFTFAGPALIANMFGDRLDLITLVLAFGRVVGCLAYFYFSLAVARPEHRALAFKLSEVRPLCASGGWLSITSVISPIMGYADRFVLGFIVSAHAVAYYVTPNELVTKLWIIPGALTAVLFPIISNAFANGLKKSLVTLFDYSSLIVFLVIAPISLSLAVFSFEILRFWVGGEFADEGGGILAIFCLAVLINCLAHVPLALLQGAGRARSVAILQMVEIPLFISLLWALTMQFGIIGAAWAWVIRSFFDTSIMLKLASTHLGGGFWKRGAALGIGLIVLMGFYFSLLDVSMIAKVFTVCGIGLVFGACILALLYKGVLLGGKV